MWIVGGHEGESTLHVCAVVAGDQPLSPALPASPRAIMAQTGRKSLPLVRRSIRGGSLFRENAAAEVGL